MDNPTNAQVAIPLQFNIDTQLGPDGYPWIRMQFATPAMSASIVFPSEAAEGVIAKLTDGIREQLRKAHRKVNETTMPDFTGIGVKNGQG